MLKVVLATLEGVLALLEVVHALLQGVLALLEGGACHARREVVLAMV